MSFSFPSNPTTGQQYAVSGGPTYTWNGTAWIVLTPGQQFARQSYTATASQSSFTVTSGYLVGGVDVYRNGVKLITGTDYIANNGTSIVLTLPANSGDSVEVISYPQIVYSNALKITGDTMTGNLTVPNITSNAAVTAVTGTYSGTVTANNIVSTANVTYSGTLTGGTGVVNIGSGQIYKDASGNVGIGTSSPGSYGKLTVNGNFSSASSGMFVLDTTSGSGSSYIFAASNYSDSDFQIKINQSGATTKFCSIGTGTGTPLTFLTGATEKMRLDTTGNLGIGTTSPNAILDVFTTQGGSKIGATHGTGGSYPKASGISFGATSTSLTVNNNGSTTTFTGGAGIYATNTAASNNPTEMVFWTTAGGNPAERARIDSTGVLSLTQGQIKFPATQVASSDANTLDDYEEGTWTPIVIAATGTPTHLYQEGYYTKIGRQVFGGGIIGISNNNTLTGDFIIGGLPFVTRAGSYGYTAGSASDGSGFTWPLSYSTSGNVYCVTLSVSPSTNRLIYISVSPVATAMKYTSTGIGTTWYLRFSFSYYTD